MFEWLKALAPGAQDQAHVLSAEFGHMLDSGRQVFDVAANALLGGTDPEVVEKDLFATDKGINRAQQRIRREVLVHASVQPSASLPACFTLMSLVKDAERIGDYAKNIFDLARMAPPAKGDAERKRLIELKSRLSGYLVETRRVFDSSDEDAARELTRQLVDLEDECDREVDELLKRQDSSPLPATYALAFRHFKRIASHAMNITTSVFMPLDKLDYYDEKPRPPIE